MKIILASSNPGKLVEIRALLSEFEVVNYTDIIPSIFILEDGSTFEQNSLIKARAVYKAIHESNPDILKTSVILSDDSGISVQALGGQPGIYSARYSCDLVDEPTEQSNRNKLKNELMELGLHTSAAFYTAAISVIYDNPKYHEQTFLGFMHGDVILEERGDNGFGYDFMFIPVGYKHTVGELEPEIKEKISHRAQALDQAKKALLKIKKKLK